MQHHIETATRSTRALPIACLVLTGCATTQLDTTPQVRYYPVDNAAATEVVHQDNGTLKVMTLNIAHGRGEGFHQLLQDTVTTRANLDQIASLLKHSKAHVVALQEADDPSFWSGNFSHVDYLAHAGGFNRSVHGAHAAGLGLSYGTALMSRFELIRPQVITFDPSLSPTPKGFVVSTLSWPGQPDLEVDIVSLHLDFTSKTNRRKQAEKLVETLQGRQRPLIVTGDFNNDWQADSAVQYICQALALQAYRPEAPGLETFPRLGARLDWILVSPELAFRSYQVMPEAVSDHHGVLATLALQRPGELRLARTE